MFVFLLQIQGCFGGSSKPFVVIYTVWILIETFVIFISQCAIWVSVKSGLILIPNLQMNTHTHTRLTALFPGLPGWASTRKVKPIWILLKQETVSGSGNSWAICKSAPRCRQITMPAPHHSVFYRPDALPASQPTVSKHWRQQPTDEPCIIIN